MGLDWAAVPVRLDDAALRTLRADAEVFDATGWRLFDNPERETFLDRRYEQVEYLLDPLGFAALPDWEHRRRSLPYRIVHGDTPFADHADSGQGIPWRCSDHTFLATAAAVIDGLDVAAVRRAYSMPEMARLGVYKAHGHPDTPVSFAENLALVRRLGCLYAGLATAGRDVVIELY